MTRIIDRICDAEWEAISNVFGVSPEVDEEMGGRNDWFYFMHDYKFRYNNLNFKCKLFRVRSIDYDSHSYYISGLLTASDMKGIGGAGANISEFQLMNPDDRHTIENKLREALNEIERLMGENMNKSFNDMVKSQRDKQINKDAENGNWRRDALECFESYMRPSSSENDFDIILEMIRHGTQDEVIEQANAIIGMMENLKSLVKTGRF